MNAYTWYIYLVWRAYPCPNPRQYHINVCACVAFTTYVIPVYCSVVRQQMMYGSANDRPLLFVRYVGASVWPHCHTVTLSHCQTRSAGAVGPVASPTNTDMRIATYPAPETSPSTVAAHTLSMPIGTPSRPSRAATRISSLVA